MANPGILCTKWHVISSDREFYQLFDSITCHYFLGANFLQVNNLCFHCLKKNNSHVPILAVHCWGLNKKLCVRFARLHSFPSRSLQGADVYLFLPSGQLWRLLEGKRCSLANQTQIKIVQNNISDIFHLDLNNVAPKLKLVNFI